MSIAWVNLAFLVQTLLSLRQDGVVCSMSKKKSLPNICLNSKFLFSDNCPENQTDVYSKAINKNLLFADPDKEQHIDNLFHS